MFSSIFILRTVSEEWEIKSNINISHTEHSYSQIDKTKIPKEIIYKDDIDLLSDNERRKQVILNAIYYSKPEGKPG